MNSKVQKGAVVDSVTQELDWEWLKGEILAFLTNKEHDVNNEEVVKSYRSQAYEKGFTSDQVSKSVHRLRIRLDEDKQRKQAEPPPPAPEQPKENIEVRQAEKPQEFPGGSRPSNRQHKPTEGMNNSGYIPKGNYSGPSILDIADAKRKAPN